MKLCIEEFFLLENYSGKISLKIISFAQEQIRNVL